MEEKERKLSTVALHIYKELFTYPARNNWILEETTDPGSKSPEPSSYQTLYAAVYQQKGEVHNFSICMQTEQLTFVNRNILNICRTRHTEASKELELSQHSFLFCEMCFPSDCKCMQKHGAQEARGKQTLEC